MNINQKRFKSSHIYTNSSKPINYSEKIISFSPSRKYKNALINLREGLNELENIDNIDNKKMNNKTINNQIGNTYMNNVNKLNFVNMKSEDHKKFMNVKKKSQLYLIFKLKLIIHLQFTIILTLLKIAVILIINLFQNQTQNLITYI